MKRLRLNPEYLRRHLFCVLVFLGLAGWFGYDGFVRYPATDAAVLFEAIEKVRPEAEMPPEALEAFKLQKIRTQYGFAFVTFAVALVVALRLGGSAAFDFAWDGESFVTGGRRYVYADIVSVDRRAWEKQGILGLQLKDGRRVRLDAWHHLGVDEFQEQLG